MVTSTFHVQISPLFYKEIYVGTYEDNRNSHIHTHKDSSDYSKWKLGHVFSNGDEIVYLTQDQHSHPDKCETWDEIEFRTITKDTSEKLRKLTQSDALIYSDRTGDVVYIEIEHTVLSTLEFIASYTKDLFTKDLFTKDLFTFNTKH